MTIINSVIKGKQPVIDTLNVTPTTSAQQITAPQGTDGYSPVNVSAVTSSIDANITAGNIKDGVSILGVTGNVVELNGSTETVTPTTSQQTITPTSPSNGLTSVTVNAVTSSIDANIVAGNIKKDVQILGVTGSYEGTAPTGTVNITSNGTHNVSSYEYAEVLVPTTAPAYYIEKSKDANNVLQNGSTLISFSGLTGIGNYALSYAYYRNTNITGNINLNSLLNINGSSACESMFSGCTGITSIDLNSLTTISGSYACKFMFENCLGITSIDLSSLTTISGAYACQNMFSGCTGITSIDLHSLRTIATFGCSGMFQGCTGITSVDLSGLVVMSTNNACSGMFQGCTGIIGSLNMGSLIAGKSSTCCSTMFQGCSGITSVNLSSLTSVTSNSAFNTAFSGCTNLTSVDLSHFCNFATASSVFSSAFANTSLTSLSFPNLAYTATNLNGNFSNTLSGVTGCTVHFPAEWQTAMSSWSNITNGMGGTNTTVLFDLPNVTTLDLSHITRINYANLFNGLASGGKFPNITSVNLSSLTRVTSQSACNSMFQGCSGITSVNLSSCVQISGNYSVANMFAGTGITSLLLPALKSIDSASGQMMDTVTCTVHLPSNLSGTVTSTYFGSNITLLFDLPATNILTGADTKEYERNPKYDTATALAWRINGTMPNTTTYYTSGLTDPTVGTTIYSDSACTIAETTVDSIS